MQIDLSPNPVSAKDALDRDGIDLVIAIAEAETAVSHLRRLQAAIDAGSAQEVDVARFVARSRSALCDAIVCLGKTNFISTDL